MSAERAVQAHLTSPEAYTERAAALLPHMVSAAARAADLIASRAGERADLEWRVKAHADFVSDVDTAAETIIRDTLGQLVPGSSVMGEELSPGSAPGEGTHFIVDPLDGTTNFLHGYPEYAVSIALVLDGTLAGGVVHNAVTGECFTAYIGGGAERNGSRISVSRNDDPSRALIGTGFPFRSFAHVKRYLRQFEEVSRATSGLRRAGSAALDLCDVACGRFDAFWELELSPWDFSAGVLIIREAGGIVSTLEGTDVPYTPSSIVAGSSALQPWLLKLLQEAA
ncbi:MAG TPA: inositol monophosphatase family protein [Gemmatimonadaceae bacterium]|nr:inositol monophosphatase family protein [Gemmatimonadaceae bacterium]